MKTYSTKLMYFIVLGITTLVFFASNANASSLVNDEIANTILTSPPSSLSIVSITPFAYNGGVNIRCWGQSNGRATVVVSGGDTPYTYSWSNLPTQTGATALGMSAGTYTVTVTDASGASVSASVTLIQNPPIQATANISPILCNGGVATITMTASGGTLPHSGLNWYQAVSGTHIFTVGDANGCRDKDTVTIGEPTPFVVTATASPILCNGDPSHVLLAGSGGIAPYTGTGVYVENAGTSNYVITDANGCYGYASVTINQPPVFAAVASGTPVLCRGGSSSITVSGLGGTMPYTGTGTFSGFSGNYYYTVTDNNGCQDVVTVNVAQPAALVASISSTLIQCNGGVANITVSAMGGTAPYSGVGVFSHSAGLHSFPVMDANGCSVTIATFLKEPKPLLMNVTWEPISTEGGTTNVHVTVGGGIAPYTGTGVFSMTAGTYDLTVTDANGCSTTQTIITAPGTSALVLGNDHNQANSSMKSLFVQASNNTNNETIDFAYHLTYDSKVRIEMYDMTGSLVEVFAQDHVYQGENQRVSIPQRNFRPGMYIYHLITDTERHIDKVRIF